MGLEATIEGMVALQSVRTPHGWWAVAQALQAVLDSGNEEASAIAHEKFNTIIGGK